MPNFEPETSAAAVAEWRAYESSGAHLRDQIARLDLMIGLELEAMPESEHPDLRGLVLTRGEVAGILGQEEPAPAPSGDLQARLAALERRIDARVERSWRAGTPPALETLASVFSLTPFEKDVLLVVLAPEVHRKYDRLYAYLQDDVTRRRPSVDLVLKLLCRSFEEKVTGRSFFRRPAPLLRHQLLTFADDEDGRGAPLLSRFLKMDDRIVDYLLDGALPDPRPDPAVRPVPNGTGLSELLVDEVVNEQLRHLTARFRKLSADATAWPRLHCRLEGPYGSGKQAVAAAVCHDLALPLLAVDLASLVREGRCSEPRLRRIVRETLLTGTALLYVGMESVEGEDDRAVADHEALRSALADAPGLVFFAAERSPRRAEKEKPALRITLPTPGFDLRKKLWQRHVATEAHELNGVDLDEIANRFRFTGGQIRDAVRQAVCLAVVEKGDGALVDRPLLWRGCREQCNHKLGELAQKISPVYGWNDIVLEADRRAQLDELCAHVRFRHRVLDEWGFGDKMNRGRGLNALFAGPSGTGKTMAAEILAGELGMDLYKIDLSCVVSKYIGETEKNLAKIFAEAEQSNAILFFDEADALFGKRTEVKDSHDRYANIEINYLLQKVEEYEGVVILATNQRGYLDEAFTRRLRFCIDFPFPDETQRRRIWQVVFPPAAPCSAELDIGFLASRFKLSGGNIKNVALSSAFFAAACGSSEISMQHVMLGIKREYQKMGKIPTKAEFGKFFKQMNDEGTT